jgi:hypothetical protein
VNRVIEKPDNLGEMLSVAESLSKCFGFIRVDLYSDGSQCLVGEVTNCHEGAAGRFIPAISEMEASKIIFNS